MIPPILHPLGKYWQQPDREEILLDNKYAVMETKTFDKLLDYSASQPSGVYPGKMWKHLGKYKWFLCWYSQDVHPDMCRLNYREILLIKEEKRK